MGYAKDTVRIKKKEMSGRDKRNRTKRNVSPKWEAQEMPSKRKEKGATLELTSEGELDSGAGPWSRSRPGVANSSASGAGRR